MANCDKFFNFYFYQMLRICLLAYSGIFLFLFWGSGGKKDFSYFRFRMPPKNKRQNKPSGLLNKIYRPQCGGFY